MASLNGFSRAVFAQRNWHPVKFYVETNLTARQIYPNRMNARLYLFHDLVAAMLVSVDDPSIVQ